MKTDICTCGTCGLSWDDAISTSYTPVPSGRCPFEYFHDKYGGEPLALEPSDIPANFEVRPIVPTMPATAQKWFIGKKGRKGHRIFVIQHGVDSLVCAQVESHAAAKIIAAAPATLIQRDALLEALEELTVRASVLDQSATNVGLRNCDALSDARLAIDLTHKAIASATN